MNLNNNPLMGWRHLNFTNSCGLFEANPRLGIILYVNISVGILKDRDSFLKYTPHYYALAGTHT